MKSVAGLLLCAALVAACSGGGGHPAQPVDPSSSATDGALAGPEVKVCERLPAALLSLLLGVQIDQDKPAIAGGTLLGECDYARAEPGGYRHIFIGARADADYDAYVARYTDVHTSVGRYKAEYGAKSGLLIKVPRTGYFLQIAVQGADGDMLLTPARTIAEFYLG